MTRTVITEMLESRSIIITEARVDVLAFLIKNDNRLSSLSEILNIREQRFNRITIYRTLVTLCETSLIYKIEISNKPFYAISRLANVSGNKPIRPSSELCHFRCESCNAVFSFPSDFNDFKLPRGLKKTGIRLFVTGYCPDCTEKAKSISGKNTNSAAHNGIH